VIFSSFFEDVRLPSKNCSLLNCERTSWPHTNEKNLQYFLEGDDSESQNLKIGLSPLWMILSLLLHV